MIIKNENEKMGRHCNEPRKLDKKLSGFYNEEKAHNQNQGEETSRHLLQI